MELKKVLVFKLMSIALTMVLAAPTQQSGVTASQNQTSSHAVVVNRSGVPPGLMMLRISGTGLQIRRILDKAKTVNRLLLQKYPFINRDFLNPPINQLHLITLTSKVRLCHDMPVNSKLAILHPQLATFQGPLDLVYKYELNQSPKNDKLVQDLQSTKNYVDETVARIRKAYPKNLTIPMGRNLSESQLDSQSKMTLTTVQSRTQVAPTPANVKIYRNFVIVNVLIEAIRMMDPCIP